MRKKILSMLLIMAGILFFNSCQIDQVHGRGDAYDLKNGINRPVPPSCEEVSHVNEVTTPLNPEPENLYGRCINIIKFQGELYAIYTSGENWCHIHVAKQVCGDEWIRTNTGDELPEYDDDDDENLALNYKSAMYANSAPYIMRLIEYRSQLYAIWNERNIQGTGWDLHVKQYNKTDDVWVWVDGGGPQGLSSRFVPYPRLSHWAYFYYAAATVFNDELYIVWQQAYDGTGKTVAMKYDENEWTELPQVGPDRGHDWIALAEHNNKLHLAAVTGVGDHREYLTVYELDTAAGRWTRTADSLGVNLLAGKRYCSLLSFQGSLYLAWRECTRTSTSFTAFPYKIYVKKLMEDNTWEFVGANPVVSGNAEYPILVNFNCKLTLVTGNNDTAYVKQLNGVVWEDIASIPDLYTAGRAFPKQENFSAFVDGKKLYFAWRKRSDPIHFFCGHIE